MGCNMAIQVRSSKPDEQKLQLQTSVIEVLSKVSPSVMEDVQQSDLTFSLVTQYSKAGKSKSCHKFEK